jgi:hypothetical protein
MFPHAVRGEKYACFLAEGTRLDFMYMPDVLRAIIALMEADELQLGHRNAYNVTAMSLTPSEIATEIRKHVPRFAVTYKVDPVRQAIANGWLSSLDDSAAARVWRVQKLVEFLADVNRGIRLGIVTDQLVLAGVPCFFVHWASHGHPMGIPVLLRLFGWIVLPALGRPAAHPAPVLFFEAPELFSIGR